MVLRGVHALRDGRDVLVAVLGFKQRHELLSRVKQKEEHDLASLSLRKKPRLSNNTPLSAK
jgi:hypothetical protein